MFENPGGKLKGLAIANFIVIFIAGIIVGIILGDGDLLPTVLIGLASFFVAWVGSIVLYGFGELVETNSIMAKESRGTKSEEKSSEDPIDLTFMGLPSENEVCECCGKSSEVKVYRYTNKKGTDFINICDDCKENRADEIQKMIRK